MFPISRFSHILVDTPPLPIPAKYDQLVKDVNEFKRILHEQGKDSEIEKGDADMGELACFIRTTCSFNHFSN